MFGRKRPRIIDLNGIKIPLDENVFSPIIMRAIKEGWYEQEEAAQLPKIIEQGERVLEIGGGIGYVSALIARDTPAASIRVFEANPLLIPIIENLHRLNNVEGVDVCNGVLADNSADATSNFYVRQDFWASSLIEKPWGYEKVIEVSNMSFATEMETYQPSLIVCDIEGGELGLFENADLGGVQKVYLEVHQQVLGRKGMKRLFDAMSAKNFHYDEWHSCGSVVLFSHVDRAIS